MASHFDEVPVTDYSLGDLVYIREKCGYRFRTLFGRVVKKTKAGSLRIEYLEKETVQSNGDGLGYTEEYKLKVNAEGEPISTHKSALFISRKGGTPKKGDSEIEGTASLLVLRNQKFTYNEYY